MDEHAPRDAHQRPDGDGEPDALPVRHWHIHPGPHEHMDAHGHVLRHVHIHTHPIARPGTDFGPDHHPHGDHTGHTHTLPAA
jgi:hypothetical protein